MKNRNLDFALQIITTKVISIFHIKLMIFKTINVILIIIYFQDLNFSKMYGRYFSQLIYIYINFI